MKHRVNLVTHIYCIYITDWSISPHSVLNEISGEAVGTFVSVVRLVSVCNLLILAVNTLTLKAHISTGTGLKAQFRVLNS